MADTVAQAPMLAQAQHEEKLPKNKAAQELKRRQVESLSPERRQEIAREAAKARWAKEKEKDGEPEQSPPKKPKKRKKH